jgi:dUTPase
MSNILRVKKLNNNAIIPKASTSYSAGLDIAACKEGIIKHQDKGIVETGLSIEIP